MAGSADTVEAYVATLAEKRGFQSRRNRPETRLPPQARHHSAPDSSSSAGKFPMAHVSSSSSSCIFLSCRVAGAVAAVAVAACLKCVAAQLSSAIAAAGAVRAVGAAAALAAAAVGGGGGGGGGFWGGFGGGGDFWRRRRGRRLVELSTQASLRLKSLGSDSAFGI